MYKTILKNDMKSGGVMLIQLMRRSEKFYIKYVACEKGNRKAERGKVVTKIYAMNLVRQAINRCNAEQKAGHRRLNFQPPLWAKELL